MLGRLVLRGNLARASLRPRNSLQFPSEGVCGPLQARNFWWSKPATAQAKIHDVPPEPIVQPPLIETPAPTSEALAETVLNAVPPLQYGDFAALGLTSLWPSGIISWSFELLQVSTGMPWFYTIIAGTLFWRAALVPATVASTRNAALLRPLSGKMKALDEQVQGVTDHARKMELMLQKQKLIEQAGISPKTMFLPPVVQMVGSFGLFFAIKRMVELPVVQLTQSGVAWLPDLTLAGDYVMPSLVLLAMNAQFAFLKGDMDPSKPEMAHVMNVARVAMLATLPMMTWMPVGLWLSVLSGLVVSTGQSALLRLSAVRKAFGIPLVEPAPPVTMRETGIKIVEWYRRKRMEAAGQQIVNQRKPNWTSLPKSKASRRSRQ